MRVVKSKFESSWHVNCKQNNLSINAAVENGGGSYVQLVGYMATQQLCASNLEGNIYNANKRSSST